ncbi:sensor histidine kinase [Glycomyces arizonensis]|uniref:sensor histidine kinase n=1 Tax=Glycomyces arizonensis TaxID=256035 RepID=UPI00041BB298|nr:sensor histidine kinase [Glycomyces arizonensis]
MTPTDHPPHGAGQQQARRRTPVGEPLRLLRSARPWRSIAWLLTGWVTASLWIAGTLALLVVPALGVVLLLGGVPFGGVERWRLRMVDPAPAPSPHRPPDRSGVWRWMHTRIGEPATWRSLGYALVFSLALSWVDLVVGLLVVCVAQVICWPLLAAVIPEFEPDALFGLIPGEGPASYAATVLGLALLPPVLYLITAYAAARAALTRYFLVDRDEAGADRRVRELSRSRERILSAMDAGRSRIERDLHDGTQQRLTGLIMTLGMARLRLADASEEARAAVEDAYRQARTTLAELRELVRGIHPQVLTVRGLSPAVADLAERCAVPVDVRIDLPQRPPEPIEAAAWFVISEALTNVAKHSRASRAWVHCRRRGSTLVLEIGDDGIGGADPAGGTGLLGLSDRASVLHGTIVFDSPKGGPTRVRAELPCDW